MNILLGKLYTTYITELIIDNFNISNSLSLSHAFSYWRNIETIDISTWDTHNVTDMSYMFSECVHLTTLNINFDLFNTDKVTDMSYMFNTTNILNILEILNNINTSNVTNMSHMLHGINSYNNIIPCLDLSHFNVYNVTDMSYFVAGTYMLSINWGDTFNTYNVTTMKGMFHFCDNIEYIDISNFNTKYVTNMSEMFSTCNMLKNIKYDSNTFQTVNVTDMSRMFYHCTSMEHLSILKHFNTQNVIDMDRMFIYNESLTSLDLHTFNTSNVISMIGMFVDCNLLKELDLSNFYITSLSLEKDYVNLKIIHPFEHMCANCSSLQKLDVRNFILPDFIYNLDTTNAVLSGCNSLTTIICRLRFKDWILKDPNQGSFNPVNVSWIIIDDKNVDLTFSGTATVTSGNSFTFTYVGWDTKVHEVNVPIKSNNSFSVTLPSAPIAFNWVNQDSAFSKNIKTLSITKLDTSLVTDISYMFTNCNSLTSVNLLNMNVSEVVSMDYAFAGCGELTELNLSTWNLDKVKHAIALFIICGIETLNVAKWNINSDIDTEYMFVWCSCNKITCKQSFKNYCLNKADDIGRPNGITWNIVS